MNINHFKTMMSERDKWRSKFQLIIIFGIFSMISNFTGIEIENGHIVSGYLLPLKQRRLNGQYPCINNRCFWSNRWTVGSYNCRHYFRIMSFIYWRATYLISSIVIAIISGYFGHQTIKQNTYPSIKRCYYRCNN